RGRQHQIARLASRAERPDDREPCGLGIDVPGPEIHPRPDEDVPEALDRRRRLAVASEERPEGLARARSQPWQPREQHQDADAIAEAEVPVTQERPEPVADLRGPARLVD